MKSFKSGLPCMISYSLYRYSSPVRLALLASTLAACPFNVKECFLYIYENRIDGVKNTLVVEMSPVLTWEICPAILARILKRFFMR